MPTFAALQQVQSELIRKAKSGSAFLAPVTATAISETFVTGSTAALAALPVGYVDLGWLSNDGMSFSRDVSTAEVTSFGSVSPTRSDVTSDTSTVTVTCQETKLLTIGLATGIDTAAIKTPTATTGAVMVRKPIAPGQHPWLHRGLALRWPRLEGSARRHGLRRRRLTDRAALAGSGPDHSPAPLHRGAGLCYGLSPCPRGLMIFLGHD
jgi:hypothetical protein